MNLGNKEILPFLQVLFRKFVSRSSLVAPLRAQILAQTDVRVDGGVDEYGPDSVLLRNRGRVVTAERTPDEGN